MSIRKMEIEDLRKVVELEHTLFLSPWNEEDFSHELEENPMAGYYVLEKENEIKYPENLIDVGIERKS